MTDDAEFAMQVISPAIRISEMLCNRNFGEYQETGTLKAV